jgi:cardiolipin synthase
MNTLKRIQFSLISRPRNILHFPKCTRNYTETPKNSPKTQEKETGKARNWEVEDRKKEVLTIPNMLTLSRLALTPVLSYTILTNKPTLALSIFTYCAVSDVLDGYIARRFNMGSRLGSVIDPIADKVLVATLTLSLYQSIPGWLIAIIIGRDVGLLSASLIYRFISLPKPITWNQYWDASTLEVKPTNVSKANTAFQLGLLGSCILFPVVGWDTSLLWPLHYLVAGTSLYSWGQYAFFYRTHMQSGKAPPS